ncbi:MAG: hypothetical protein L0229_21200 [Blastocatellia bacterium]|nr:hypothetical protein [Blastocatellia bacterium]
MAINLEKILVHANERLTTAATESEREAQIEAFKRFLSIESSRLKNRHRFGLSGSDIASGRSYMIDLVVCRVCQSAASEHISLKDEISNCAVVALGGYGRRELSPCSDIDLLFLHAGKRSKGLEGFWEHVLYLLWDMGLTVGHSYRSVRECIAMGKDLHSRNAMSEARLITGSAPLFRRFTREMDENVFRNKSQTESYLEMMRLELEARYARFERTVCRLEPNVKESAGGLRDLHTVLWVGHTIHGARGLDDLRAQDRISGAEYAAARRAYDFILRLRNEAHFTTGRRTDLITLDLQPVLAENLGYRPKRGLLASEIFMREYTARGMK